MHPLFFSIKKNILLDSSQNIALNCCRNNRQETHSGSRNRNQEAPQHGDHWRQFAIQLSILKSCWSFKSFIFVVWIIELLSHRIIDWVAQIVFFLHMNNQSRHWWQLIWITCAEKMSFPGEQFFYMRSFSIKLPLSSLNVSRTRSKTLKQSLQSCRLLVS